MADIYRISFVKLLRALAEQARNDFADEVFDAESTGERPDLEPVVVEIAVEFAEDISDAIEALQARVLEHDRIVAEKDAEIARLREALTPSAETKAAYWSEVECDCPTETWRHYVPWTSIKQIMKMIRARAALKGDSDE